MDPIIINHPGLNLAGYSIATRMENGDNLRQIPEFWGEYAATLRQPLLAALGRADAAEYGLIHDFDPDSGRFGYMIGMECAQPLPLPPGCARRNTPPAKYAVFTTQPAGSDAEFGQAIQAAWRYIMQDWRRPPSNGSKRRWALSSATTVAARRSCRNARWTSTSRCSRATANGEPKCRK